MRKSLRFAAVIMLCCAGIVNTQAQNLVLNPSFETISTCPQGISQFNLATNWAQGNSGSDSCTTSDLYAPCVSQIGGANSPNGLLGYQPSRTGTNHAGIILSEMFIGCAPLNDNYREYIEGHLSSPMQAGQRYLVRFFVSLPEGVMAGTDDFGVYLSNTYYSHNACTGGQLMPVTPQLNYCGPPILDTLGWTELRWIYTAVGGESYLTIGNFKNDANTTYASFNCQSFNPYVYYYIDDVEVSAAGPNECSFALTTTTTNASCVANNGTATVNAVGCTSPFTYAWQGGSTNATLSSLAAGTYTVTVIDASSCSSTISAQVGAYTPPAIQVSTVNTNCSQSNGTAFANVLQGTGPYTYHWSNNANTQVINNLAAGTYTVTITGAGTCTATASGVVAVSNGSISLTGTSTPASCGANNGSATVTATGNGGPFTYAWSNSQNTQTISGLAAGTYTVTVTGSSSTTPTPFWSEDFANGVNGWQLNVNGPGTNGANPNRWIINNNADCPCSVNNYLHITCDSTSFFCFGNMGACTYFPGSPIPNPLFGDPTADKMAISPLINTTGKSNMQLTFKYVVGGDANNDYGQVRFSSDGGNTWLDMPTKYSGVATCTTATISVPNNFENISNFKIAFRWVNNADGTGDDPGFSIDDIQLIEGGGTNCPAVTSVVVTGSSSLSATATSTSANCGQNNGTATAVVQGTGTYTYTWSGNAGNTATVTGLSGGTYTVTVSAGGGCSATATTTVSATAGLNVTAATTNATCGQSNGTATANVAGAGPFTYNWSNSASSATISSLPAGTYTVTVSQSGCSATATAVVVASAGLGATFTVNQPSCGQANGSLTVSNITGGTNPVTTEWKLNNTVISTGNQVSSLGAGTYTFHAADASGCTLDTSFTFVGGGSTATIQASNNVICVGDSAEVCAPAGFVAYQWNTGETSQCIQAKLAGNYYVTVTDAGNCTVSSNHLAIGVYPQPPVSITVNGDTLTSFNAVSYQWYLNNNPINGANSSVYIATQTGNYQVQITDTNGCSALSNKVNITVSGIEDLVTIGARVYPNPTSTSWFIEAGDNLIGSTYEVVDYRGRVVYTSEIRTAKSEVSFDAAQGVYMLRIHTAERTVTHKLVKL